MRKLWDSTNIIIKGEEDYPVWVSFTKMDVGLYNNADAEEISHTIEVLFIVNNGSIRVVSEGRVTEVGTGQGVWVKKNRKFKILLASNESASLYSVAFNSNFFLSEGRIYEQYGREYDENHDYGIVPVSDKKLQGAAILDGLNRLIAINLTHKRGYELTTKGILCNVWLLLLEYMNDSIQGGSDRNLESRDEKRVKAACEYMAEHYSEILTLGDIAGCINVSEGECCRCFERVLYVSPIEYLMKYRIYSAAKLLLKKPGSVDSISDLSFITGFNSPNYFNRVFKRYMQCSPGQYRKMIKEDADNAEKMYISIQEEITVL